MVTIEARPSDRKQARFMVNTAAAAASRRLDCCRAMTSAQGAPRVMSAPKWFGFTKLPRATVAVNCCSGR